MEKTTIRISVRNLVEFILRSGDLDNRGGGSRDKEAMQLGSRIHRKIQKKMGASYQAEVPLTYQVEYEEFFLTIEGRADGIIPGVDGATIDEIKGTFMELHTIEEALDIHYAQALCYAYIYGTQQEYEKMIVQITYCNMETEEIKRFSQTWAMEKLSIWFDELVAGYYKWALLGHQWRITRNASMKEMEFPFPYRKGQRDIVAGVYATIARKKELFVQAPTGIGKTMSAVFPAVRAVGEGLGDKIFYLTAKTITRTVAQEAFGILKEQGLKYKVITITAKEKICACENMECNPEACPRAKGHFDRVNDAVYEMLESSDTFDGMALLAQSEKWSVCPYEMSLDAAIWADAIICDYNYVFDPRVHLKRFFGEGVKGEYLFLIDEAHNLVERGREMFSASLYKEDFLAIKRLVRPYNKKLEGYLEKCNRQLLVYKRECDTYKVLPNLGAFPMNLMNVMGELEKFLEEIAQGELQETVLEFYFQVRTFIAISELVDENYVVYSRHDSDGRFCVRLYCVNPAVNLQERLKKGNSAVFFSATLLPMQYYKTLFSTREDDYAIRAISPFDPGNRAILLGRDVSSRYTRRGYDEYRKIADYIHQVLCAKEGNYLIFFPSYRFMESVYEIYEETYETSGITLIKQSTSMNEAAREEFLQYFHQPQSGTLAGFCVMGGIFAEGIDLIGERLIGAIVVGTGIPQIGYEREILMNFYNARGENGFDFAYRFPGMNKVLQAAGRVIRTGQDRGVILLLDNRFLERDYRDLFPEDWSNYQISTLSQVASQLSEFWENSLIND